MGISSNAGEILRRMKARPAAVVRELTAVAPRIGREINTEARRIMVDEIYSVPIPFVENVSKAARKRLARVAGRGKHGRWKRTGNLLRQEKVRTRGPVVEEYNRATYAADRHRRGTPGGRPIRTPGVRSVQWQTQALHKRRNWILQMRRKAVFRALSAP